MNEQFVATVEAALARAGVLRADATLLVALSGGADSVALLYALCEARARHGLTVRAAHVEHGLRGEASLADAAFCRALCEGLSVPFTCDHAGLEGGMDAAGAEARAREARYALLLARAREANADALLTAHHMDDQAETVLSRLIRGSGARGLSGMREATVLDGVRIVRPLLSFAKADILTALGGAPYREDASNGSACCQRNRLRADVLPLLNAENPRAAAHIAQSARLLALDEDCLATQANELLSSALWNAPPLLCVRRAPLAAAPKAVSARALRAFAELGLNAMAAEGTGDGERSLSAGDTLALLDLLAAPHGRSLNLPRGLCSLAGATHLHLLRMAGGPVSPGRAPAPLPLADCAVGPSPRMLHFGMFAFILRPFDPQADAAPDGVTCVAVPLDALPRLALTTARGGEQFTPFGAGGGKPLRRWLTDRKLDLPFRPVLPLLCEGDAVWWAAGLGAGEQTRLTDKPAALLRLACAPPWLPAANQPMPCTFIQS